MVICSDYKFPVTHDGPLSNLTLSGTELEMYESGCCISMTPPTQDEYGDEGSRAKVDAMLPQKVVRTRRVEEEGVSWRLLFQNCLLLHYHVRSFISREFIHFP